MTTVVLGYRWPQRTKSQRHFVEGDHWASAGPLPKQMVVFAEHSH
ncbi:hypothetical protein [Streptomyces tardus]|nr:hypothetical protein [Streptomyces tardus]